MKNNFLFFLIMFSFTLTGVSADEFNIIDYFPCNVGDRWVYSNGQGRIIETRIIVNQRPDQIADDGTILYVSENQAGSVKTATTYSIKNNRVVIISTRDADGTERPVMGLYPIVLAPPNQEWNHDEQGRIFQLKTAKAACSVGNNNYADCIMLEERVAVSRNAFDVKKSYFAKGIGLVLVTQQSGREREAVILRLASISLSQAELWKYESYDDGIVITEYVGDYLPGMIPDNIQGDPVIGIETRKPVNNGVQIGIIDALIKPEEIIIPSSIQYIGDFAFYQGTLRRVTIPASVKSVGDFAFANNRELNRIAVPYDLELGKDSFEHGFVGLYNHLGKVGGTYTVNLIENSTWSYAVWAYNRVNYIVIIKYKGDEPYAFPPTDINGIKVFAILSDSGAAVPEGSEMLIW